MTPAELLTDAFERIVEGGRDVVDGLDDDQLTWRAGPDANPIGWLVWHLARVQDDHVAEVAGLEQVWTEHGFEARFGLPYDTEDLGFGQTTEQVGQFRGSADLIASYLTAVHERTVTYLATLTPADLDRVVDDFWDPPVTLGVRLVSVVNDDAQHLGQAAYVRGLLGA